MRTRPPLTCGYDALKARGKRPVPMWADRFLRDTLELTAEEIGAYHLILYAMWKRPECALQNDDSRLARIARVSVRKWRAQVGPAILGLMDLDGDALTSSKLLEEAAQTEDWCIAQHARKCECCKLNRVQSHFPDTPKLSKKDSENQDKSLINNNPQSTVDYTVDEPTDATGDKPSQRPNIYTGGGYARAHAREGGIEQALTFRERILEAIGADPVSGLTGPTGKMAGTQADMELAKKWICDLALTEDEAIQAIREVMAKKKGGPPATFAYFSRAMERLAGIKGSPKLEPDTQSIDFAGGKYEPSSHSGKTRGQFGGGYEQRTTIASVVARSRLEDFERQREAREVGHAAVDPGNTGDWIDGSAEFIG